LTSCAPLLAANPRYATDDGAGPQGAPTTTAEADGPPALEAPKNDLSWQDCTSRVFSDAAVPALPGITLDCATYEADLDPIKGADGRISIGVVRATSVDTPTDAGPVVIRLPRSVRPPGDDRPDPVRAR
ncbi:MAG: putative hydrolase or acyltransferase of alpha/beta superfamily, partial [Mycobacterium sp.]|nr:putative hydrolase or acyltransferase of alpha/beta superfamily [Mycobacterium sp.]